MVKKRELTWAYPLTELSEFFFINHNYFGHVDDGLVRRGGDDASVLQVLVRQLVVQTQEVGKAPGHCRL